MKISLDWHRFNQFNPKYPATRQCLCIYGTKRLNADVVYCMGPNDWITNGGQRLSDSAILAWAEFSQNKMASSLGII